MSASRQLLMTLPSAQATPVVAGRPLDPENSSIVASPTSFLGNGVATTNVTMTVEDSNGTPLAGSVTLDADIGEIDTNQSQIGTDKSVIASDGVDECTVFITVKQNLSDGDGEALAIPYFAASNVQIAVTPSTGVTITQPTGDADFGGTVTAKIKSTSPGTVSISATAFGVSIGTPVSIVVGTGSSGTNYETSFEDTTFSALNNNGWVWGGSTRSTLSTENPRTGLRSMRMAYQAAAAGSDSRTEQRFNFGQNLTEFWMEWYVYLPANYTTRAGESPSNNKWFRIWGDDYSALNKIGASTDYNASFDDNTRLRFEYIYKTYTSGGIGFGPSGSQSPATSFGGSMKGNWVQVRLHCKMVSATGADDGVMELWFGGTKVIDFQNVPAIRDTTRPYWNQGYIFGAANSGFLDETVIYVDDWKFWSEPPDWSGSVDAVTDISRDAVSTDGGDLVTITTVNHQGQAVVHFDGVLATEITRVSATQITCRVPAHAAGIVDVTVNGVSLVNPRSAKIGGAFEYLPTPTTTFIDVDFEGGTIPADLTASGTVTVSTTRAYKGTYSALCSRATTGGSYLRNTTNVDVGAQANGVYSRFFLYMDATTLANLGDQIKTRLFRRQAGDGQPGWIMTGIGPDFSDGSGSGDTYVSFIDNGILNINGTPNQGRSGIGVGAWVEFLYWDYWDAGLSQGRCKLWVNGKLLFDVTNASLGSANTDYRYQLGIAYVQNPIGSCEVFLDEIFVGNGIPPAVEV